MKVLQCHDFYQEPGGEDAVFADEGALLRARGHEVVRFTRHNRDIEGIPALSLARKMVWNDDTLRELGALLEKERPDVVHCTNTFPLISPAAYVACRRADVPVVQSLHNYRLLCPNGLFLRAGGVCEDCIGRRVAWPGVLHGCYRGRCATAAVAAMQTVHRVRRTWLDGVDRYIALSRFSREKFVAGGLPPEKLAVKPNFVDPDPGPGPGDGGFVLFAGRLAPEKGLDTLLDAWRGLGADVDLRLRIVGDGELADRAAAAADADPRIEYLGRRSNAEVLDELGRAAALVLPSICFENCPKALIEAFAKGTPVIASRLGALQEMVDDGIAGLLFAPGDAGELAAALRRLVASPAARREMRGAARAAYETRYTAAANYEALIAIYESAVAAHGPPPSVRAST